MFWFNERCHDYFFNPRLREGGDGDEITINTRKKFSIHASAKEATVSKFSVEYFENFQSTPPRRRRRKSHWQVVELQFFQSTPPRRRRQLEGGVDDTPLFFSIHASAKEATATYCNTPAIMCISSLNNFFVHHF